MFSLAIFAESLAAVFKREIYFFLKLFPVLPNDEKKIDGNFGLLLLFLRKYSLVKVILA